MSAIPLAVTRRIASELRMTFSHGVRKQLEGRIDRISVSLALSVLKTMAVGDGGEGVSAEYRRALMVVASRLALYREGGGRFVYAYMGRGGADNETSYLFLGEAGDVLCMTPDFHTTVLRLPSLWDELEKRSEQITWASVPVVVAEAFAARLGGRGIQYSEGHRIERGSAASWLLFFARKPDSDLALLTKVIRGINSPHQRIYIIDASGCGAIITDGGLVLHFVDRGEVGEGHG